jgi:hypothetical protein
MNFTQTGIMPCATFITVPFQKSSSQSFKNCPIRTFRALVFSKSHSNAQVLQYTVAAQAMEVPGWKSELQWVLQQMSGVQNLAMPNPLKAILVCGYGMIFALITSKWPLDIKHMDMNPGPLWPQLE